MEHLQAVRAELATILAGPGPKIELISAFDADDQAWVLSTGDVQRVENTTLGLVVGDAVQNLRAALDHLVLDLSILDSAAWPIDSRGRLIRTQFPVHTCKTNFDSSKSVSLAGLNAAHVSQIEAFQPFVTGSDAVTSLVNISNEDKHRVIQTVVSNDLATSPFVQRTSGCEVVGDAGIRSAPFQLPILQGSLDAHMEIARLPLTNIDGEPHVDIGIEVLISVTLRDGRGVGNVLEACARVVEEILRDFEQNLATPHADQIRGAADAAYFR